MNNYMKHLKAALTTALGYGLGFVIGVVLRDLRIHVDSLIFGRRVEGTCVLADQARRAPHLARIGAQAVKRDSVVKIRRPAGGYVRDVIVDKHTAVDRPQRFHLFVRYRVDRSRSCAEPPDQLAVGRPKTVHPAVP